MSGNTRTTARRAACLGLSILITFLSYKPAIAILAIAGAAKNPTEGRREGVSSEVDSRENMPRPARKQQREAPGRIVQKIQKSRTVSPDEKVLLKLLLLGSGQSGGSSEASKKIEGEIAKPDYLRLFLPAAPGSPHSPPA
jgi:hypothetical protein